MGDYILWFIRWIVRHEALLCNLLWWFLGALLIVCFVVVLIG